MYSRKEYRTGLGRLCRPPINMVEPEIKTKTISRIIAVLERAIWQIRHTGLADKPESNSTAAGASSPRRPQTCALCTVADSRTVAKHATARQRNQFVDRFRMFTVPDVTPDLDATPPPLSGSRAERS